MVIYDQYPFLPVFALLRHFCFSIDHRVCSESRYLWLISLNKLSLVSSKVAHLTINPDSRWIAPDFATPGLLRSKVPPALRLLFRDYRSMSQLFPPGACTRKPLPGA